MDMNIEASHIVEVSTIPSSSPKKLPVPLIGLERFPTQQEIEGQDARNRRPVRPIDRQRMRPWLMELLDMGNVFGLRWTNRNLGIFQISWRHASRLGWNLETDGDVFERWARHTGIYKEGDPPEPKRWKANFRCALHSLSDVLELTNAVERRGRNACRTYQFLQNSTISITKSKTKKPKAEPKVQSQRAILPVITYERTVVPEPEPIDLVESASSDELLSETESEGSQKDKVIVQRVETKSQDTGEDFILHHDHDYSAGPLKTQKTIYLRQGVGSIVLQREIHSVPDEEEIKYNLLSNLDQLASAAVGSETITVQRSPVPGLLDAHGSIESKISPAKLEMAFDENKDKTECSLKNLLPRLRARIRESEKAGGAVRKRKGSNVEADFEEVESPELKGRKKEKDAHSPPSPPMTRHRSNSPKKAVKVVAKSKRSRKESDESTSDSTEPLMSSCLLLLEAATRLDNAEKNGSSGGRSSSKSNKKGSTPSTGSSAEGKRRTSGRNLRSSRHAEEQTEGDRDAHFESFEIVIHDGDTTEVSQEMVIEEAVCPDEIVQVIYEGEEQEQPVITEIDGMDDSVEMSQYHDILRTTLENIGSELEVSTDEFSVAATLPKEMAIMRRKRDPDKASSQNLVEISGQTETSAFPKGLFSGSEIITDNQQEVSIVRKRIKGKNKTPTRDNIYYVDIHGSGSSICIKQSDSGNMEEKDAVSSQIKNPLIKNAMGIQQTVIKRELPVLNTSSVDKQPSQNVSTSFLQAHNSGGNSPQIFIAAAQNSTDQQIIVPANPGTSVTGENSSVDQVTHARTDSNQAKQLTGQLNQGGSFITVGPNGKALLYKSDTAGKVPQRTTIIPLVNPMSLSSPASNVKISTLPISSSTKPSVNISAPFVAKESDQTLLTASPVVPFKFVPRMTSQAVSSNSKPTQVAAITSGGRAWILQPRTPTPDSQVSQAATIQMISSSMVTTGQPRITTMSSLKEETDKSVQPVSSVQLTSSASFMSKTSAASLLSSDPTNAAKPVNMNLPTQVIGDPVKGSILQLPLSQLSTSQTTVLPTPPVSDIDCDTISTSEVSVLTSPSTSLSTVLPVNARIKVAETETVVSSDDVIEISYPSVTVSMKNEISVAESILSSNDDISTAQKNTNDEAGSRPLVISSVLTLPPQTQAVQNSVSIQKEGVSLEDEKAVVEDHKENISELELQSSSEFISPQLDIVASQESDKKGSDYQTIENATNPTSAEDVNNVNIIVQTVDNEQQIFLSSDQEVQGDHIHTPRTMSGEELNLAIEAGAFGKIHAICDIETTVVGSISNVTTNEISLDRNSKEEIVSHHHCHDSMSMDPSAPLAIGEIPLFAASKGDSDYMGSPGSD